MGKLLNKRQSYVFFGILFFCSVFLLWKIHYGYIFNDEPFMITLGHRFLKGDMLLVHEWQKCQTTGIFIAPIIWLYTSISGTTEGLILFCRFIYVVWWIFVGVILYRRLKQFGWISIIAVSSFLMFTPLDQMNITYNAISLSCILLFVSYFLVKGNLFLDFLNGVVLAAAVLVYPYLIILYFIYMISVLVVNATRLKNIDTFKLRLFDKKLFLRTSISAIVLAVIVISVVFSAGVELVFNGLRDVLETNGLATRSVILLAKNIIASFPLQTTLGLAVFVASIIDKNREKRKLFYFVSQSVIWVFTVLIILLKTYSFNLIMFPMAIVGLQTFVLTKNKNYLLMFSFWVTGIIFGLICYISSDTGIMAISTGVAVSSIASIIIIFDFYKELNTTLNKKIYKNIALLSMSMLIVGQIGGQTYLRVVRSYWDELLPSLNKTIPSGAAKGITTTDKNCVLYMQVYNDAKKIKDIYNQECSFLSIGLFPSVYIDMDFEYGTYSSWVFTNNKANYEIENEKLKKYYNNYPDKKADIIFSNVGYVNDYMDFVDFSEYDALEMQSGIWYVHKQIES